MTNNDIQQTLNIPTGIKLMSKKLLKDLIKADSDIQHAVLTTEDGFVIASETTSEVEAGKLAAMASALSAISTMSITETNLGSKYKNIIIESDEGFIMVTDIHVPKDSFSMVLNVVADKTAVLGKIIYSAKVLADSFIH